RFTALGTERMLSSDTRWIFGRRVAETFSFGGAVLVATTLLGAVAIQRTDAVGAVARIDARISNLAVTSRADSLYARKETATIGIGRAGSARDQRAGVYRFIASEDILLGNAAFGCAQHAAVAA